MKYTIATAVCAAAMASATFAEPVAPDAVIFEEGAITASLTGKSGDSAAGQKVMNKGAGNCIACHQVSTLTDIYPFHGEVAPTLDGVADRWSEAELRGIVTNAKMMFEDSMMPSFYKTSGYIRPGNGFSGKAGAEPLGTLLSAEQIEDVVAYLLTLKE